MTRLAVFLTLIAMLTLSSAGAIDAQRRGGGGRAGGGSSGRGSGFQVQTNPSAGAVDAQRRGGGGRAGVGSRGRGSGFQVRVNLPPAPGAPPVGMSISRPIGTEITGVQTNPPPGFGRRVRSPFAVRPGYYTRLHPLASYGYAYGYGSDVPGYGDSYAPESTYEKLYRTPEPVVITEGMLLLDVTPAVAQVFIDSAFVGSVDDLQTRGLTLAGGRHWLDLEAPNYERKTVEVTIRPGEPLRYRYDMTPERRAPTITAPAPPPQTMYMIAGCYAGNRPPSAANLPNGCDIRKVRVIPPATRPN